MPEFQICSRCKKKLPLSKFYRCKFSFKNRLGRQHYCRKCATKYRKENPEKHRGKKTTPEENRKDKLKYRFNMTVEQYDKLFEQQNGLCAICHKPEIQRHQSGVVLRLTVDHDHQTGKIRGLLCRSCNLMLGSAKDNIDTLLNAVKYLRK